MAGLEATLRAHTQNDENPGLIAHVAQKLLAEQPGHVYAQKCLSVAYMHMGNMSAALRALAQLEANKKAAPLHPSFYFQKAYCCYRQADYAQAKKLLKQMQQGSGSDGLPLSARHLMAQICYNTEDYQEAADIYAAMLRDGAYRDEEEQSEVMTNYTAALAAVDAAKVVAVLRDEAEEKTPDLLFNLAVAQMSAHEYGPALKTLQQVEKLYAAEHPKSSLKTLEQALDMDEAALSELLADACGVAGHSVLATKPLRSKAARGATASAERRFFNAVSGSWLQQGCIAYLQHRYELAARVAKLMLAHKPSSAVTSGVALVLAAALEGEEGNLAAARQRLDKAEHGHIAERYTSAQTLSIQFNRALLYLSAKKTHRAMQMVQQMEKSHPGNPLSLSLSLLFAVKTARRRVMRETKASGVPPAEMTKLIEAVTSEQVKAHPHNATLLHLLAAQLHANHNDLEQAAKALESSGDAALLSRPATVATMTAWKVQAGSVESAAAYLQSRLNSSSFSVGTRKSMLAWAVHYFGSTAGRYDVAAKLLQDAGNADAALKQDKEVMALQVLCLSVSDPEGAQGKLEALEGGSGRRAGGEVDVDALVSSTPGRGAMEELGFKRVTATDQGSAAATNEDGSVSLPRRYRARPLRRPAKVMEGRPDPERWIPMPLRSYVKDLPGRRKKEMKRLRALEQEQKRRAAQKRKAEEAAAA